MISSKFLSNKDYSNLCLVNKQLYKSLRINRFKMALRFGGLNFNRNDNLKELSNDKRLKIWLNLINKNMTNDDLLIRKQFVVKDKENKVVKVTPSITSTTKSNQVNSNNTTTNNQNNDDNKEKLLKILEENNSLQSKKSETSESVEKVDKLYTNEKEKDKLAPTNPAFTSNTSTSITSSSTITSYKQTSYGKENNNSNSFNPNLPLTHLLNLNYQDVLSVVSKESQLQPIYDTIYLDVLRTFYNHPHQETMRLKLFNILKIISWSTSISYCQGMNYIGAMLLFLNESNEKSSFELFYLLVQGTEYKILFEDELFVLKRYFYIYERLVELLLPDVSKAFKANSIQVAFYSSSWFITLFSSNITDEASIPLIVLHIWDEFILYGWRAIFKVAICLLKIHSEKLIQLKYEEMLQYLLNELFNTWFFNNNYISSALPLFLSIKLPQSLLLNLEAEYELRSDTLNS